MKRWIIRSFLIGLLLLCVGGWVGSYWCGWIIRYSNPRVGHFVLWDAESFCGKIYLWHSVYTTSAEGWHFYTWRPKSFNEKYHGMHEGGGFGIIDPDHDIHVAIPFWFPTTFAAALLWLVWHWTRPKISPSKAFPVEMSNPSDKP